MIIDCHTHIGRSHNIKASVSELLKSMDEAGIDKALVFASHLGDAPNEYLLEQIKPHLDRLYGVAMAYPGSDNKENINQLVEWYLDEKIVAVKFYTGYEHRYPFEAKLTLDKLNEIGCPAIFHSGDCHSSAARSAKLKYAHPLHIDEVAVDYPNINFIIAHVGFPWIRDTAQVCYKNSNVYTDMSGFVYGEFNPDNAEKFFKCLDEFYEIAPREKMLFGTDWPISSQKSYVETFWGKDLARLYSEQKIDEMTVNIKKVFKL